MKQDDTVETFQQASLISGKFTLRSYNIQDIQNQLVEGPQWASLGQFGQLLSTSQLRLVLLSSALKMNQKRKHSSDIRLSNDSRLAPYIIIILIFLPYSYLNTYLSVVSDEWNDSVDASSYSGEDEPERSSHQLQQDDSVEIFQHVSLGSGKFNLRSSSDLHLRLLLLMVIICFNLQNYNSS